MPELMEDDPIVSAFAQFRADARTEIQAPGTERARHTIGRRQRVRLAAVAVVVAVGLGGGWLALGGAPLGRRGLSPAEQSSSTPTYGPTRSAAELERLAEEALGLLGYTPGAAAGKQPTRPGVAWGAAAAGGQVQFGTADEPFPSGMYEVRAACIGAGSVTVTLETATGGHTERRSCPGSTVDIGYALLRAPGQITILMEPDAQASGRAGYAIVISDPRIFAARDLLGPDTNAQLGGGAGDNVSGRHDEIDVPFPAGRYRLTVACSGSGELNATLALDTDEASKVVPCTWAGGMARVELQSATGGAKIAVTFVGRGAEPGDAAFAYRLERL